MPVIVLRIKNFIAHLTLRLARYKLTGPRPDVKATVLVAAPHTSNWDFPLMLAMAWLSGLSPIWLGKQEMFFGPLKWIFPKMGGIPVDRKNPGDLVKQLAERSATMDQFSLVIPAEGTRSKGEYWKSGFYRIAREAGIPITLSWLDGPTRTGGIGLSFMPTGNVKKDMDLIREFYADKGGVDPKRKTPARLREEPEDDGFNAEQAS